MLQEILLTKRLPENIRKTLRLLACQSTLHVAVILSISPVHFWRGHNSVDSGIETGKDVQEAAPKDTSTSLCPSLGLNLENCCLLQWLEPVEYNTYFCYMTPNVSSLSGDNVTIICSTLQEDTTYWVKFPEGMGRIEAVCKVSCGQPCLKIQAPPKEQPGTVLVTVQDLNEQDVNDYPLTLTYEVEQNSSPLSSFLLSAISQPTPLFFDSEWSERGWIPEYDQTSERAINDDFISSVLEKIAEKDEISDEIVATCKVFCHAAVQSQDSGPCKVESSKCRRSAALLGIEPSSSEQVQDIVTTAIKKSWHLFESRLHTRQTCSDTSWAWEKFVEIFTYDDYEELRRQKRQQLRHQFEQIKREGAGKGSRREQRRQRRVERMKRTGKAGKTGQQI